MGHLIEHPMGITYPAKGKWCIKIIGEYRLQSPYLYSLKKEKKAAFMMKKMWKKWMAMVLTIACITTTDSIKRETVAQAKETWDDTRISTNYYKPANVTISISNYDLVFEDLPDEVGFQNQIMVSLYEKTKDESIHTEYLDVMDNTVYNISGVPDGIYYVELYYWNESYGWFWPWYQSINGVGIEKNEDGVWFLQEERYQENVDIYNDRLSGKRVLDYYSQPIYSEPEIKQKALEITENITDDYQKVKAIHDWVSENVWYDWDYRNNKSDPNVSFEYKAPDILKSRKTVCMGYADLATALLRSIGIPTKSVEGYSSMEISGSTYHGWNEAYVDGRWVIFDCTWDSSNSYQDGVYSESAKCGNRYFDVAPAYLANKRIFGMEIPLRYPDEYYDLIHDIPATPTPPRRENVENAYLNAVRNIMHSMNDKDSDAVSRYMNSNKDNIINDITNIMIDNGMDVKDENIINNVTNDIVKKYLDKWLIEKPAVTDEPVPTKEPVVTKEPLPSIRPVITKKPVTTETPVITEEPVITAKPVPAKKPKITITTKTKKVKKGKTLKLTAKKQNVSGKIKWKSSNKKVAKVSSAGKVTAKKKGKVTITAYIGKVKTSIKITIY